MSEQNIEYITDVDREAQKTRSRRYGITIREDGNVTKPSKWANVRDSQWGDPVNYLYPVPDKSHAANAKSRFQQNKGEYDTRSRGVVRSRLNRLLRKHELDPIENDDGEQEDFSTGHLVGPIQLEGKQGSPTGVLIPAARVATFKHPWYGDVHMDEDLFDSFVDNWQSDVMGVELAIDAEHRRNSMLGGMSLAWIDDLFITDQGVFSIHATPTNVGKQHLGETYKYASIEYHPHWHDQETGIEYGPTLIACAATNHPFVHRNQPISTFEEIDQTPSGIFYFVMPDKEVDMSGSNAPADGTSQPELPVVSEIPKVTKALTLPDGTTITAEEVAQIRADMARTREQLKTARIEEICNTASDRGVAPVVIKTARQFLEATEMDAKATIELETGEPDDPTKKVNIFEGIALVLSLVPGRIGEVTFTPEKPQPPQRQSNANPYVQVEDLTPEEAEERARQRRQELGLTRRSVEVEL